MTKSFSAIAGAVPAIARGGVRRDRLSILLFHRVAEARDPLSPEIPIRQDFERLIKAVSRYFNPLPLAEAITRLRDGTLPQRSVVVTFDDGYADNLLVALPILRRYGVPATVFVASAFLNGEIMWNDRVRETVRRMQNDTLELEDLGLPALELVSAEAKAIAVERILDAIKHKDAAEREAAVATIESLAPGTSPRLMLSIEQVRELRREGVEIGAHTQSHPILAAMPDDEAAREIGEGKAELESVLQEDVTFFAYPNGKFGRDFKDVHVKQVAEAGFEAALTTDIGVNTPQTNEFRMQRFTPWELSWPRFCTRLLLHRGSADYV